MEVLKRYRLFKKLDPDFKINKIVTFTKGFSYDFRNILPGVYLVSKPFVSPVSGNYIVAIVNLEDTMSGHDEHISEEAYYEGFSCWRIRLVNFEEMKEFKPLIASSNFLWKGENNDN